MILPWHNPLRVVEKMILLDHLSKGRAMFGIGRGLAKREYDVFGIDMNEARDRFDEASEMIIRGLETGIVEGHGKHYKQMRTEVRPRPYASFKDRFYCVAMSSDSVPVCARLGAKMMIVRAEAVGADGRPLQRLPRVSSSSTTPRAPAPVCVDFLCCHESAEQAEALAREHMSNYYITVMEHYDMAGDHFKKMKGYGDYATNAALLKDIGLQDAANAIHRHQHLGHAEADPREARAASQTLGDFDLTVQVSYGGMTHENAEKSIRLFAKEVLPEFQSWKEDAPAQAASPTPDLQDPLDGKGAPQGASLFVQQELTTTVGPPHVEAAGSVQPTQLLLVDLADARLRQRRARTPSTRVPRSARRGREGTTASTCGSSVSSSRTTTSASGRSSQRGSGTPMTATSSTAGCAAS